MYYVKPTPRICGVRSSAICQGMLHPEPHRRRCIFPIGFYTTFKPGNLLTISFPNRPPVCEKNPHGTCMHTHGRVDSKNRPYLASIPEKFDEKKPLSLQRTKYRSGYGMSNLLPRFSVITTYKGQERKSQSRGSPVNSCIINYLRT